MVDWQECAVCGWYCAKGKHLGSPPGNWHKPEPRTIVPNQAPRAGFGSGRLAGESVEDYLLRSDKRQTDDR